MKALKATAMALGHGLHMPATLARRGVLTPGRPDRIASQLTALARWGMTPAGGFGSSAKRDPHRLAIIDDFGELTYAQLEERTTRLAHAIAAYGLESKRTIRPTYPAATVPKVGLLCRNHRGFIETVVACSKIGADIVLLNTGSSLAQVKATLADQQIELLVADQDFVEACETIPDAPPMITADAPEDNPESLEHLIAATAGEKLKPPPDRGRTIVLTSGTTGTPKGAKRPHPHLRSLTAMLSRIPLHVGDRVQISAPLFHTWGYAAIQLSMAVRATLVLQRRFEPAELLKSLARHQCRALFAVPIMLQRMLDQPAEVRDANDTSALRAVALSGSRLPGDLATRFMDSFGDVIYNLYGGTEFSWASIAGPKDLRRSPESAGRPPFGTRIELLDENDQPVAPGHSGRIFVGNDMLSEGYTNGQSRRMAQGLMDAGDCGHLDERGMLVVDGRADDLVISGGENVMPREVEDLLSGYLEVEDVTVVGVDDEEFGQRLAAYVVVREGHELDAEQVRDRVRQNLAKHCIPRDVRFLETLPRNPAGKVVPRLLEDSSTDE